LFENIQIITFILAGIVAYRSVLFGIIMLLIAMCTFPIIANYASIRLATGSIVLSDFVVLALFIRTLHKVPLQKSDQAYKLCLAMIIWLSLCGFLALIAGQIGLRETYRLIFRIALFWILPITVRELEFLQKRRLVTACMTIVGIVSCVHLYVLLSENTMLMEIIYSSGSYEVYGYKNPEEQYRYLIMLGILPRLYPPGSIFVQMVFAFVLGLVFLKSQVHGRLLPLGALVLSFLFTVSLGGRSNSLFILFAIMCTIYLLFRGSLGEHKLLRRKNVNLFFRGFFILLLSTGILMNFGSHKIFEGVVGRWMTTLETRGINPTVRVSDTLEAWHAIIGSPLWGIGQSKVSWQSKFLTYGGQDVHPFFSQGLIGGFPGIFLLFYWVILLFRRFKKSLADSFRGETPKYYALSAAVALFSALFLSLIGTTPVFLYGPHQVPFGIFSGLLLLPLKVPYGVMRNKTDTTRQLPPCRLNY